LQFAFLLIFSGDTHAPKKRTIRIDLKDVEASHVSS
jgi:hypothetical protein